MKKLFLILLSMGLLLPLAAQENQSAAEADSTTGVQGDALAVHDENEGWEESDELIDGGEWLVQEDAKPKSFRRTSFEFGINAGAGFDNDLFGIGDIFTKNIVLDMNKLESKVGSDGINLNLDLLTGLFFNVRMGADWGLGFFFDVDGNLYGNLPKSIMTLIAKGNLTQKEFLGTIGASGGVFANVGLTGFAEFLDDWRVTVTPTVYAPIMYISGKSGINYHLDTRDGIILTSGGEINIYTPFALGDGDTALDISTGFDLSLEVEYAGLFPFLDVGVTLKSIPFAAANLSHRTQYSMESITIDASGQKLLEGELEIPDVEFNEVYDRQSLKVRRPFRFDMFAVYRPFEDFPDMLIVRPNMGFTIDITGDDAFFNIGVEAQAYFLQEMIFVYFGTGYEESLWRHRLGFALNLRAFELNLEGTMRSHSFASSFQGSGFGLALGLRFGW